MIALAIYLWLRPVWRDLTQLDHCTKDLGNGDMDTRVQVSKRSAIKPLAGTFNGLKKSISGRATG